MLQPPVEILNLRIDEPITTVTDILLALICFYAFFRVGKLTHTGKVHHYFRSYFIFLGMGALTGGLLGHAFQYRLAEAWKLVSWSLTMISVALMVQALLTLSGPFLRKSTLRIIFWLNVLTLILALALTLRTIDFDPVKYHSIFGLVFLTGSISYYYFRRTGHRGVMILMGGVGIGFLSAIIFSFQWGISHWFNHRDLSHIILCFSVYYVYRGVVMLVRSVPGPG